MASETQGLAQEERSQEIPQTQELEQDDSSKLDFRLRGEWQAWGKNLLLTLFFAIAVIFTCFVSQDPRFADIGESASTFGY